MSQPSPSIVTFSPAALERIGVLLTRQPAALGVQFAVKKGGCAGQEYVVDYVHADTALPNAQVLTPANNMQVYIPATSVLFLMGTHIDFTSSALRSGFVFNNPQQVGACGCGESVQLTPLASAQP